MVQLKSTKVNVTTEEEQATKRREQLRLASQRYRLRCVQFNLFSFLSYSFFRQKAKHNANTLEHEPFVFVLYSLLIL